MGWIENSFFLSNDARLPPLPTLRILVLDELEDT